MRNWNTTVIKDTTACGFGIFLSGVYL